MKKAFRIGRNIAVILFAVIVLTVVHAEGLSGFDFVYITEDDLEEPIDMMKVARVTEKEDGVDYSVGSTVSFGLYNQDNDVANVLEPIEWLVLTNDGQTVTMISKYGLDSKQYNTEYIAVTWETCTLRRWLNNEFLNAAFTTEEQARLETVTVTADPNPEFTTDPGNDTQDRVFLLSIDEVNRYFETDDDRMCVPTMTAVVNGVYTHTNTGTCWWWLRSPGYSSYDVARVDDDGHVNSSGLVSVQGRFNEGYNVAIRPVVVLRLS